MKNPGDLNHRDLILLQRTKLDSLLKITHSRSSSFALPPNKRPFPKLPELYVISLQLIDLLQLLNHTVQLMSPFTESNAIRFRSALTITSRLRQLQLDSHIGYSVCTNRCNIGCGIGSLLSMVTSHLLAVPNTESTNCYNLWLACL